MNAHIYFALQRVVRACPVTTLYRTGLSLEVQITSSNLHVRLWFEIDII